MLRNRPSSVSTPGILISVVCLRFSSFLHLPFKFSDLGVFGRKLLQSFVVDLRVYGLVGEQKTVV
jgi:hypothetical protein